MARKASAKKLVSTRTWRGELRQNWPLYVMVIPAVVLAIIFCYIPMGGLVMAFQDYKPWLGLTGSQWVWFDNFKQIFMFKESYQAIINTLIIAVSKIICGLIVPIVVALLLNEVKHVGLSKGIQTLVYLPHFLSWITVAGMLRDILGLDGILRCGASGYHFGNAISMAEMLEKVPEDTLIMGNLDPAGVFRNGTPETVRQETIKLMEACCRYPNFVVSSGCDIPPATPWENIHAFFGAVDEFYARSGL